MVETVNMEERKNRQLETVKTFRKGLGKKCSVNPLIKNDTINEDALLDALKLAFPDITPRTMNRMPDWKVNHEECVEFGQMPKALFSYSYKGKKFSDQLKDWFDSPCLADPEEWQKAFDEFHKTACETVKDFLKAQRYEPKCITYGKAQKVVNMTFKHIYCLDGAYIKEDWFIPCHMALDSFTLEWFYRNVGDITKGCVDSWSALQNAAEDIPNLPKKYDGMKMYTRIVNKGEDKEPEIRKFYTYDQIVALIRNYFAGDHPFKGLCPLQAEFYIWPEIQLHLAAEAIYGQNIGIEKTIESAKKKWQAAWEKDCVDAKSTAEQFKWCKEKFKQIPVEQKLEFTQKRVKHIIQDYHVYNP